MQLTRRRKSSVPCGLKSKRKNKTVQRLSGLTLGESLMFSIESCFSSCFPFCLRMGRTLEATDEAQTEEPPKVHPPPGADFGQPLEAGLSYQRNPRKMSWRKVLNF